MFKRKINGSRLLMVLRENPELRKELRKKLQSKDDFQIVIDGKKYIVQIEE
jgi:hypothetical protein